MLEHPFELEHTFMLEHLFTLERPSMWEYQEKLIYMIYRTKDTVRKNLRALPRWVQKIWMTNFCSIVSLLGPYRLSNEKNLYVLCGADCLWLPNSIFKIRLSCNSALTHLSRTLNNSM